MEDTLYPEPTILPYLPLTTLDPTYGKSSLASPDGVNPAVPEPPGGSALVGGHQPAPQPVHRQLYGW